MARFTQCQIVQPTPTRGSANYSLEMTNMPPECVVEETGTETFVVLDGVRIARRGKPNTPQAGTWIFLQPGYQVSDLRTDLK